MQSKKLRKALVGTVVSLGATVFLPVQDADAQARSAASAILEEVVVTARRREETLEDAPLSVVAIGGEAMRAQGIYNTRQIGDFAANVNLQVEDRSNVSMVHIRGIGGGFANPIQVFGAGMYIDGHYLSGSVANFLSTLDVERVEVMRGPQGTLFGKNVTGGAVNIVSTRPQSEFESEILVRAGDYGQQDVRGMVNVPFSDNVFGRFTVAVENNDGYWDNRFSGEKVDWSDQTSFRGALRFTPTENWTIDATWLHYEEEGGNVGMRCNFHPSQEIIDNLLAANANNAEYNLTAAQVAQLNSYQTFSDGWGTWGGTITMPGGTDAVGVGRTEIFYPGASIDFAEACLGDVAAGDYVTSIEGKHGSDTSNDTIFVSGVWDSGGAVGGLDNLQVRTNLTYRDSEYTTNIDRDKTYFPLDSLGHVSGGAPGFAQESTSVEVIFDMEVNDRLDVLFGFNWYDDDANTGSSECWDLWQGTVFPQIQQDLAGDGPDDTALDGTETTTISVPCGPGIGGSGNQFQWIPRNVRNANLPPRTDGGPVNLIGGPSSSFQQVNTFTESKAVFAHATYAINDDWNIEFGARWTEDDRGFNIVEFNASDTCLFEGGFTYVPGPFGITGGPPRSSNCLPSPELNYYSVMLDGFFNQAQDSFSEVTPMASISRQLAGGDTLDSGMVYFLISEGFLTGSFNDEMNLFLAPQLAPLVGYQPEHVTNYEFGFKGSFAGGRVRLNADYFIMDYSDKQEEVTIDNSDFRFGPDSNLEFTQNAADVVISGIELELRASPWDGGFITLDLGYLDNEYDQFSIFDPDNPGTLKDLSNNKVDDRQPDWTFNASLGHTFTLDNGAQLTPQIGVYGHGEYEWTVDVSNDAPPTPCFQDAYYRWRARVSYVPAGGQWEASLFGENIADEQYLTFCEEGNGFGAAIEAFGRPAWWGAEFVYRWGG